MEILRKNVCAAGLALVILLSASSLAEGKQPETGPVEAARAALRGKRFQEAVQTIEGARAGELERPDEALYLKGLALYYAGRDEEAVRALLQKDWLKAGKDLSYLRSKARFPNPKINIGGPHTKLPEEQLAEAIIIVLASMHQHMLTQLI